MNEVINCGACGTEIEFDKNFYMSHVDGMDTYFHESCYAEILDRMVLEIQATSEMRTMAEQLNVGT